MTPLVSSEQAPTKRDQAALLHQLPDLSLYVCAIHRHVVLDPANDEVPDRGNVPEHLALC